MKRSSLWLALFLALAAAAPSRGQELIIASGGEKGTYHAFVQQMQQACAEPALRETLSPQGTVTNIDWLKNNQVSLAIVQADGLWADKMINNDPEADRIKTLMVLYPEEVHIFANASNGYVQKFSDLGNKRIGVKGGSTITARVLFAKAGLQPIQVVTLAKEEDGFASLDQNKLDALIFVGGKPLGYVKALPPRYKLLPFDRTSQVLDVYQTAVLTYPNLGAQGVQTVAVQSLLVTRDFKTPEKRAQVVALRNCIIEKLDQIRDTTGSHAKWGLVDPKEKGKWPYYEAATLPAKAKAAPKKGAKAKKPAPIESPPEN